MNKLLNQLNFFKQNVPRRVSEPFKIESLFELDALKLLDYDVAEVAIESAEIKQSLENSVDVIGWFLNWLDKCSVGYDSVLEIGCRFGARSLKLASDFGNVEALDWRTYQIIETNRTFAVGAMEVFLHNGEYFYAELDESSIACVDCHLTEVDKLHPDYLSQEVVVISELPEDTNWNIWLERHLDSGLLKKDGILLSLSKLDESRFAEKLDLLDSLRYKHVERREDGLFQIVEKQASIWKVR